MNIEAEIKALDGSTSGDAALMILLIRQLASSGLLDAKLLADTLNKQAEQTLRDIRRHPEPDDDRTTIALHRMRGLARKILNQPEPPEFRPVVVASRTDEP